MVEVVMVLVMMMCELVIACDGGWPGLGQGMIRATARRRNDWGRRGFFSSTFGGQPDQQSVRLNGKMRRSFNRSCQRRGERR